MSSSNLDKVYGELYIGTPVVTNILVAGTYYQLTGLTLGESKNTTLATNKITLDQSGLYIVHIGQSFTHVTNNTVVHYSVFLDEVEQVNIEVERKIGTGGDVGANGQTGFVRALAGQELSIRAKATNTGNLTTSHLNFNCKKV